MRSRLGIVLGALTFALIAVPASAAVRYAEPNGNGPASSCPKSNPCDILDAVEDPSVVNGDEVVVLPGTHDIGAEEVDVFDNINLHGAVGEPRPLIRSTGTTLDNRDADVGTDDAYIHDLRLQSTGLSYSLYSFAGESLIERIVAISAGNACHPPADPGVFRDSVCFSSGSSASAILAPISGGGLDTYEFRNLTAIATGSNSVGLEFSAGGTTYSQVVNARNVIADGTSADVSATESGTSSTVTINLENSNYDTENEPDATTSITNPGSGNNQTEPYELADPGGGDFRQLASSPTINAGDTFPLLGELDFERQPRVQGSAPDIGADEFDDRLKLKVKAKKKQKAKKLKVKVSCPEEECHVTARGKAKAGAEKFKLKKTKRRFLEAGERKKLRLKAKNLDELKQLLASGANGEAKVKVKGTDAGGVKAKKKFKVELVG
jgi:hypothetical protein